MAGVGVKGLGQLAVTVRDAPRATAFYRDVLGLKFLFSAPGMAFFESDGVRLMLAEPETPSDDHASSVLYFRVDDVDAGYAALRAHDVVCEGEPHVVHRAGDHDLWMSFFHDGEGNLHALMEERRK